MCFQMATNTLTVLRHNHAATSVLLPQSRLQGAQPFAVPEGPGGSLHWGHHVDPTVGGSALDRLVKHGHARE